MAKKQLDEMSFLDHLEDLRWHLIRATLGILIAAVLAGIAYKFIFDVIIFAPTRMNFATYEGLCRISQFLGINDTTFCAEEFPFVIQNRTVAGQFSAHIWTSIYAGFIIAFPYVLYQLWSFISPGLKIDERKSSRGFIFIASLLFFTGVLFGYYIVTPLSINFLANYKISDQISNEFDVSSVIVILVLGGFYLAYEGAEKIYEFISPHHKVDKVVSKDHLSKEEILTLEKTKVKSAIVTDFILSVEIVIIALGTVVEEPLMFQVIVVSIVALIATVGVYGIVALIVRMDDLGLKLISKSKGEKGLLFHLGTFLIKALPQIIKSLSVIGTIALILVAGGIFVHNIELLHHFLEQWPSLLRDFVIGLLGGGLCLLLVSGIKAVLPKKKKTF
ncbi:twin-arginine translocase subunit TatC [bacterium]|nr:twin-arginine translocase subunit TatC [bacterium]